MTSMMTKSSHCGVARISHKRSYAASLPPSDAHYFEGHGRPRDPDGDSVAIGPPRRPSTAPGWLVLLLLLSAQFMVVLDSSIVNVALPSIRAALGISSQGLQWVVTAYVLVFGGFLLVGGRMADLLGRRRLLIVGLLIFGLGSLGGSLAPSAVVLIAARAVQGVGAAIIAPTSLALLNTTFKGPDRDRALGWWGAVGASGFAVGVLLGGVLVQYLSWRAVLLVNAPIALLVASAAPFLLKESRDEQAPRYYDLPGALTITTAVALLVYGLTRGPKAGWVTAGTLGILVGTLTLAVLFVVIEVRTTRPLLPFGIFRRRSVSAANTITFVFGLASTVGLFLLLTLYMQEVLDYSPLITGLAFLPLGLLILLSAPMLDRLTGRFGVRKVLLAGLVLLAAGLGYLTLISANGSYWTDLLPGLLLVGLGYGPVFVTLVATATAGISDHEQGLASGIVNTVAQVAGAIGVAVYVTLVATRTDSQETPTPSELTAGYSLAFTVGMILLILAIPFARLTFPAHLSPGHANHEREDGEADSRREEGSDRPSDEAANGKMQ